MGEKERKYIDVDWNSIEKLKYQILIKFEKQDQVESN